MQVDELNSQVDVPQEFIEVRAYEIYLHRGASHGEDWADWFRAERELTDLFRELEWEVDETHETAILTPMGDDSTYAYQEICRYFRQCPNTILAHQSADSIDLVGLATRQVKQHPTKEKSAKQELIMKPTENTSATPELLERARASKSPISFLSREDFLRLRGNLVALLVEGSEKGQVIATAPLDFQHPNKPRESIQAQVASSPYSERRYQLCEILDEPATDEL